MTQQEKQLLLKDLCARLPYGVMYGTEYGPRLINDLFIYSNGPVYTDHAVGEYNQIYGVELQHIKPYLRPMSSMTEDEVKEIQKINWQFCKPKNGDCYVGDVDDGYCSVSQMANILGYLNAHHFDYRGLISMGLALEAPEEIYKTE